MELADMQDLGSCAARRVQYCVWVQVPRSAVLETFYLNFIKVKGLFYLVNCNKIETSPKKSLAC